MWQLFILFFWYVSLWHGDPHIQGLKYIDVFSSLFFIIWCYACMCGQVQGRINVECFISFCCKNSQKIFELLNPCSHLQKAARENSAKSVASDVWPHQNAVNAAVCLTPGCKSIIIHTSKGMTSWFLSRILPVNVKDVGLTVTAISTCALKLRF